MHYLRSPPLLIGCCIWMVKGQRGFASVPVSAFGWSWDTGALPRCQCPYLDGHGTQGPRLEVSVGIWMVWSWVNCALPGHRNLDFRWSWDTGPRLTVCGFIWMVTGHLGSRISPVRLHLDCHRSLGSSSCHPSLSSLNHLPLSLGTKRACTCPLLT